MARQRNVVRLGLPGLIVAALAVVALWRIGPPADDPTDEPGTSAAPDGPLTRVIETLADNSIGREASLEQIEIRQLTSATTFWAGAIDDKPVFVVVDAQAKRAPGVRVLAGQMVTLIGVVRSVPPDEEAMRLWKLDAATAKSVEQAGTYLHVTEIK